MLILLSILAFIGSIWSFNAKQDVYAEYMAGAKLNTAGKMKEAVEYFKTNVSMEKILHVDDVDVPMSIYALARTYKDLGDIEKSKKEFTKLLTYYPRWVYVDEIYWYLGSIAMSEGKNDEAKMMFKRCLEIEKYGIYAERCGSDLKVTLSKIEKENMHQMD